MIRKEIKCKYSAKNVSEKMAEDIQQAVEIFNGYRTEIVPSSVDYQVEIFSEQYCAIITVCVLECIWQVISMYELQYQGITHHLDVKRYEDRYVPSIVVCVSWNKK